MNIALRITFRCEDSASLRTFSPWILDSCDSSLRMSSSCSGRSPQFGHLEANLAVMVSIERNEFVKIVQLPSICNGIVLLTLVFMTTYQVST